MKPSEARFFVALLPPEPVYTEAWQWKEWFRNRYDTHKALNSPPHITLQMPFRYREDRIEAVEATLKAVAQAHAPFPVTFPGFGAFPPRVIYLDVERTEPLSALQKDLSRHLRRNHGIHHATHKDNGFVPHLTVAFRDLKKEAFAEAWAAVKDKSLDYSYEQAALALLKHDGNVWQVYQSFVLG